MGRGQGAWGAAWPRRDADYQFARVDGPRETRDAPLHSAGARDSRGYGLFILRRNLISQIKGGWARKKSSPAARGQEAGVSRSVPLAAVGMTSDYVVDSDAEAGMETESISGGLDGVAAVSSSDNEGEEPSYRSARSVGNETRGVGQVVS